MTRVALEDPGNCFDYLAAGEINLNELDSKSIRVINRIEAYMTTKNINVYNEIFSGGILVVTKKNNTPMIRTEDFYRILYRLHIRKSAKPIPTLNKCLKRNFS